MTPRAAPMRACHWGALIQEAVGGRVLINAQIAASLTWRGQARIVVEVEARACPLRQLQKTHGGVGVLPYLPPEQPATLPASEDVTAVTGYSSSTPLFFGCPARPCIFWTTSDLTWQHHRLMIVSTIVIIQCLQWQMSLTPMDQFGNANSRLDASLLQ